MRFIWSIIGMLPALAAAAGEEERWDLAVVVSGVIQHGEGATRMTARCELEPRFAIGPDDELYIHIEGGEGDGFDLNGDAAPSGGALGICEIRYLHRVSGGRAVIEAGKLCLGGPGCGAPDEAIAFDGNEYANDERVQFLADAFVNNPALEFPEETPAVAVRFSPAETVEVSAALADAEANWNDLAKEVFAIAEVNLKPRTTRGGNYRLYAWSDGLGVSLDQELADGVGIFVRYGRRHSDAAEAWSAGVQAGRMGLAYGRTTDAAYEHQAEVYVAGERVSLHGQWARNADGDVWLVGARTCLSF